MQTNITQIILEIKMGRIRQIPIKDEEVLSLLKKENTSFEELVKRVAGKIKKSKDYVLGFLNALLHKLLSQGKVVKCECVDGNYFALA